MELSIFMQCMPARRHHMRLVFMSRLSCRPEDMNQAKQESLQRVHIVSVVHIQLAQARQ